MRLNLEPARRFVESLMADEEFATVITITRPDRDPPFNKTTGLHEPADEEIYSGPALVSPSGNPYINTHGEQNNWRQLYECGIPLDAGLIMPEDLLTITENPRDEGLVGLILIIEGPIPGTYAVYNRFNAYYDRPHT